MLSDFLRAHKDVGGTGLHSGQIGTAKAFVHRPVTGGYVGHPTGDHQVTTGILFTCVSGRSAMLAL
jgi:hypothetical protein